MAKAFKSKLSKHVSALHINGMNGRMLTLPAKKKNREILLLYGHHASLERMFGLAESINEYGRVTLPDLPGFGGMDSFYKIGEKPTLDNYADYLASFVKMRYKRRRVTIIAMSFSVPLIVRMLQRYPELTKKVDMFISLAGFVHRDDFIFSKQEYWGLRTLSFVLSKRIPAAVVKALILNKPVLRLAYGSVSASHGKMKDAKSKAELYRRIDFETTLWNINDMRTRWRTMKIMLTMDLCNAQANVKTYHVSTATDRYFDNAVVEQHLRVIFKYVEVIPSEIGNHAPTILATAKEAEPFVPKQLRTLLSA